MLLQADVVMTSILEFRKRQFRNDPGLRMVLSRHPESVIHALDVGNFASDGAGGENSGARLPPTLSNRRSGR